MDTGEGWSRERAARWVVRAALLGTLLALIALLPPDSPPGVLLPLATEVVTMVVFLVAVLHQAPTRRRVWWALWCSQALVVAADLVYAFQQYHVGVDPFPGWADPLYLASYLPELLAVTWLIAARHPGASTAQLLDSLIISLPILAVTIVFVVLPMLTEGTWTLATVLAVAYPILDVVVLTALIRLSVGGGHRNRSLGLLTASVSVTLVADLVYNGLVTQGLVEQMPGWLQAFFTLSVILMAASALSADAGTVHRPELARGRHPMSRGRLVGFGVGSIALPVLLALGAGDASDTNVQLLALFAVAVNLLILWRALMLLRIVADQRHELAALARTDALTGLPNRRSWDFEVQRAAVWSQTSAAPLTVAILDLDNFHAFNETNGHQAGDEALRACAQAWRAALPADAYLARYGGEEFALLLPGAEQDEVQRVLDHVRRATPRPLTVSIGYSAHHSGDPMLDTVAGADAALFAAKRHGRDIVIGGHLEIPHPQPATLDLRPRP